MAGGYSNGYLNTSFEIRNYEGKIKMNNLWILAQTDSSDAPSGITSEQISSEEQTTTTTQSDSDATPKKPPILHVLLYVLARFLRTLNRQLGAIEMFE